jgi:hypothetical protein
MLKPAARAAVLFAMCAAPAMAHHSYVMFDESKTVTSDAYVSVWQFTNPHGKLWVYINNDQGKPILWALESPGPAQLLQHGWDKYTVKPGDKVSVTLHPLRNGDHGGSLLSIKLADGREFQTGGPPPSGPGTSFGAAK